jgi:hypothetical protein
LATPVPFQKDSFPALLRFSEFEQSRDMPHRTSENPQSFGRCVLLAAHQNSVRDRARSSLCLVDGDFRKEIVKTGAILNIKECSGFIPSSEEIERSNEL